MSFVRNECQTVGHDFILNSDGEQTHYNYKCAPSRKKYAWLSNAGLTHISKNEIYKH